jgi:Amidase
MTELWRRSASELATLIANKEVSASEVVDAHLERIEAVNSKVNAVVRVLADKAQSAAAEADRKVASGEPLGPLHGVYGQGEHRHRGVAHHLGRARVVESCRSAGRLIKGG